MLDKTYQPQNIEDAVYGAWEEANAFTAGVENPIIVLNAGLIDAIRHGVTYANVHTDNFTGGEIRGQIGTPPAGPTTGTIRIVKSTSPAGGTGFTFTDSVVGGDTHAGVSTIFDFEVEGAELIAEPVTTPWNDRNVRLQAPDGTQLTLFSPVQ